MCPALAASCRTVFSFNGSTDGAVPHSSLINVGGLLYGTTFEGGASNWGVVFALNPKSGIERVVHSFKGYPSDGYFPASSLTNVGGQLYGTTSGGGADRIGIVFAVALATGAEKVVHKFSGYPKDGNSPVASLINVNGTLYGTTEIGGANNAGTVFGLNVKSGIARVVYSFKDGSDGAAPQASLLALGGTLYGTTSAGGYDCGGYGCGTVFALNPATGKEKIIYSFHGGSDGANPEASLLNVRGTLYGTTNSGGLFNAGTVFSINPVSGAEKVLHSFGSASDGSNPRASLINLDGILYGTTLGGGAFYSGTVFSFNPDTSGERILCSFRGYPSDGGNPAAGLIIVGGTIFGTTNGGGNNNSGTVYTITP